MPSYPRDMRGYGRTPPDPKWPGGAKIAVQFVVNYEEGGENAVIHGDKASEAFLSEIVGAAPWPGQRHMNMESIYEYGARAGFWRLWRMFTERAMPVTVYGVATALERSPEVVAAMLDMAGVGHGDRVLDLGTGDGRILIAAARRGASGTGAPRPGLAAAARVGRGGAVR